MENKNLPEYAEESGRKAFLYAGFKLKKDAYRRQWWPNYSREKLPEVYKLAEKAEFEEWYKNNENK